MLPKIATGFCSGVSNTGTLCGALSGAIMGIGLVTGRVSPDESVDATYELTRRLLRSFREQFGSTDCRDLTGCDLSTEEGQQAFRENEVHQRCQNYVEAAAGVAKQLIEEHLSSSEESV